MLLSKVIPLFFAASVLASPVPVGKSPSHADIQILEIDDTPAVMVVDVEKRQAKADFISDLIGGDVPSDLDNSVSNLITLLEPQNFDVIQFTEALFSLIATPIGKILPVRLAASLLPRLDLNANLILSKLFILNWASIPGYNTVFDAPDVDTGRAVWFAEAEDRTEDDPVIIYAHGGGYVLGLYPNFISTCNTLYEGVSNSRLSILVLDYTLALDKQYPQQLNEFTNTYNELSKTSKNIIVMGDSAGVHLCLQFLRHQNYAPYDGVVAAVDTPVTGGLLFSPAVNIYPDPNDGTFKTNAGKDYISAELIGHGNEIVFPERWMLTDPAFTQYKDDIDWASFTPEVFVARGQNEVLYDSIGDWAAFANVTGDNLYTEPNGVHDAAVIISIATDILPNAVTYMKRMGF